MPMTPEELERWRVYSARAHAKSKANPKPCSTEGCDKQAAPRRKLCYACRNRRWRDKNPDAVREYGADYRARLKQSVVDQYGGGCNCCGETIIQFMTLDHVDGDAGGRDRRNIGVKVWSDARKRHGDGYYQILCWNCNSGRHLNGGVCPHNNRH